MLNAERPILDFWYDFASTYSYPCAMRIEPLARQHDIKIRWRPFLLGAIFVTQDWRDSPFNIYPRKGRYMWRDMERICARDNLPLKRPDPFPQNSLLAARVTLALPEELRGEFTRNVYKAEFGEGLPIAAPETLAKILGDMQLAAAAMLEKAASTDVKELLKTETALANTLDLIGAPSFVTAHGEMFWGNDRLEEALDWAFHECS